jgi:hypothetical protein
MEISHDPDLRISGLNTVCSKHWQKKKELIHNFRGQVYLKVVLVFITTDGQHPGNRNTEWARSTRKS